MTNADRMAAAVNESREPCQAAPGFERETTLLQALTCINEKLLLAEPRAALPDVLEHLGRVVNTNYVCLLENVRADSITYALLRYEWISPDATTSGFPARTSPYAEFSRWAAMLSNSQPVLGRVQDFTQPEQRFLEVHGIRSIALIPVPGNAAWWGTLILCEYAQERVWSASEIEMFRNVGIILGATFARQNIREEEREQRALAEALRDIGAALNRTLDMDQVLDEILANLGRVVPHDSANIILIDEGIARLARARGYHEPEAVEALRAVYFPANSLFDLREIIENGHPVAIRDTQSIPAWANLPATKWIRSYAGAPIHLDTELIGLLNVDSAVPGLLTQVEADRLQAFADQAAIAIRNARLYQRIEELATFQERQRLARELHDGVSQALSSANLIADVLPRVWEISPERGRKALEQLHQLTQSALTEMRVLLMELRPEAIVEMTMSDLLTRLGQVAASRAGISVKVALEGDVEPAAEVKLALYRIAQEALNNIVKHAQATEGAITLLMSPGEARLLIRDNGIGFLMERTRADHFGLTIMHERAEEINAELMIDSQPGRGTQIDVLWPSGGAAKHYGI